MNKQKSKKDNLSYIEISPHKFKPIIQNGSFKWLIEETDQ